MGMTTIVDFDRRIVSFGGHTVVSDNVCTRLRRCTVLMDTPSSPTTDALSTPGTMTLAKVIETVTTCREQKRRVGGRFRAKAPLLPDLILLLLDLEDEMGSGWKSGIACDNTTWHVIMLDLHVCELESHKLDSALLLDLKHLVYLGLSGNDFGTSRIPEFIGSMKQLEHLDLSNSNFLGLVPHQLDNLF
ncbi:hypothetical protein Droror1_Dr00002643 [Drosera rotundifolia]